MKSFFKNPLLLFLLGALLSFFITRQFFCHECYSGFAPIGCNNEKEGLIVKTDAEAMKYNQDFYDEYSFVDENIKRGGNIDKCALLAIIKSLESGQTKVEYRFGLEVVGAAPNIEKRIFVIFRGGVNDQSTGQKLMYRTGTYDISPNGCFCPNSCNGWLDKITKK